MINTIDVIIKMGPVEIMNTIIIPSKNICYVNNKKYAITEDFTNEVLKIISVWKNEYSIDNNIDSEEFFILVNSKDGQTKFHGKGVYPHNYDYLKKIIGDLNDRRI